MINSQGSNNFYSFFEKPSIFEILRFLEENGWTSRKSGLDEFELSDFFSELELYPTEGGALLNGHLTNGKEKYFEMVKLFERSGANFRAELYDESKSLLLSHNYLTGNDRR